MAGFDPVTNHPIRPVVQGQPPAITQPAPQRGPAEPAGFVLPWENTGVTTPSPLLATRQPQPTSPLDTHQVDAARGVIGTIRQQAQLHGVPPAVALAVAKQESGYRQEAVSSAGAIGIMQLEPDTAQGLGVDPNNWKQNIAGGVRYLREQYEKYGNWNQALQAYNGGGGNVGSAETQHYSQSVMAIASQISGGKFKPSGGSTGLVQISAPLPGNPVVTSGFGPRSGGTLSISEKTASGTAAFDIAQHQLGQPYLWGGTSRASGGFDCSGLVQWAYKQIGVNLPRVAADQFRTGTPVSKNQLKPGDLVFLEPSSSGPQHVVMYAGKGVVIAAPHTGTNVQLESLDTVVGEDGWVGARRYVAPGKPTATPDGDFHAGVDLAAPLGTPVHAMIGGRVTYAGYAGAGGNTVEIQDKAGRIWTYHHMAQMPSVRQGAKINAGTPIGTVGATGQATGPHTQIGAQINGRYVNPMATIKKAYNVPFGKVGMTSLSAVDFLAPDSGGIDGSGQSVGGSSSSDAFLSGSGDQPFVSPQGNVDAAVVPGGQTAIPANQQAWQNIINGGPASPETKNLAARAGATTQAPSQPLAEVYNNPGG